MKFLKNRQIMTDIETMSTRPNAVIVSIGACEFNLTTKEITDTFYINIDPASCKSRGLHIDMKTVAWWADQTPATRNAITVNPQPLDVAINAYLGWMNADKHTMFWTNGSFDMMILTNAIYAVSYEPTWKYWNEMDYRTLLSMLGTNNKEQQGDQVSHNALDDAIAQTKILFNCFK